MLWVYCEDLQKTLDKLRSGLEVGLDEVDRFISHPVQVQETVAHVVWDGDQLLVTPTMLCVTRGADLLPRQVQERGQSRESGLPTTQLQIQGTKDLVLDKQSENMFTTSSSDTSNNYKERSTTSSDDCGIEARSTNILCPGLSSLNGKEVMAAENGTPAQFYCKMVDSDDTAMEELLAVAKDTEVLHPTVSPLLFSLQKNLISFPLKAVCPLWSPKMRQSLHTFILSSLHQ